MSATIAVIRDHQSAQFLIAVGARDAINLLDVLFKAVTVKLLPFDHNEYEVPTCPRHRRGHVARDDGRTLDACAAAWYRRIPRGAIDEAYAGTSVPFNFNGLVRAIFLRNRPEMGDLMVRRWQGRSATGRYASYARSAPAA